jgi:hypothetical protein
MTHHNQIQWRHGKPGIESQFNKRAMERHRDNIPKCSSWSKTQCMILPSLLPLNIVEFVIVGTPCFQLNLSGNRDWFEELGIGWRLLVSQREALGTRSKRCQSLRASVLFWDVTFENCVDRTDWWKGTEDAGEGNAVVGLAMIGNDLSAGCFKGAGIGTGHLQDIFLALPAIKHWDPRIVVRDVIQRREVVQPKKLQTSCH